jgi:GNAT superfamily N-acetyltransferase
LAAHQSRKYSLRVGGTPLDVIIRPREADDDPEIVSLSNHLNPELPQSTVDEYQASVKAIPPGVDHQRFVAEHEGGIVGYGLVLEMFWVEQSGSSFADITVYPDHRGKGIGSRLYEQLLQVAQGLTRERLYAEVRDDRPQAQRFAAKRGFIETGHIERLSYLDVQKADLEGYDGLEERLRGEGIQVTTLAELGPRDDQVLRAVHAVDMSTARDTPSSEVFYLPFERWREFLLNRPGVTPESIFVALERDQVIGLATLGREGGDSAWHRGTGVERVYRGRGIARLLKLREIRWACEHGVNYLYTGNDVNNSRMYEINMRLGYRPLPGRIEMVKELKAC